MTAVPRGRSTSASARRIESLGHIAEHVADRGLAKAADSEIRTHAVETRAVIVTKDEDFAVHRVLHEGDSLQLA